MNVIRYSHGFNIQVVREVEAGHLTAQAAEPEFNIHWNGKVLGRVRQLGSGRFRCKEQNTVTSWRNQWPQEFRGGKFRRFRQASRKSR